MKINKQIKIFFLVLLCFSSFLKATNYNSYFEYIEAILATKNIDMDNTNEKISFLKLTTPQEMKETIIKAKIKNRGINSKKLYKHVQRYIGGLQAGLRFAEQRGVAEGKIIADLRNELAAAWAETKTAQDATAEAEAAAERARKTAEAETEAAKTGVLNQVANWFIPGAAGALIGGIARGAFASEEEIKKQIDDLKTENTRLRGENTVLTGQNLGIRQNVQNCQTTNEGLTTANTKLSTENEGLTAELATANERLTTEIRQLHKECEDASEKLRDDLTAENTRLTTDNAGLSRRIKALESTITTIETKLTAAVEGEDIDVNKFLKELLESLE